MLKFFETNKDDSQRLTAAKEYLCKVVEKLKIDNVEQFYSDIRSFYKEPDADLIRISELVDRYYDPYKFKYMVISDINEASDYLRETLNIESEIEFRREVEKLYFSIPSVETYAFGGTNAIRVAANLLKKKLEPKMYEGLPGLHELPDVVQDFIDDQVRLKVEEDKKRRREDVNYKKAEIYLHSVAEELRIPDSDFDTWIYSISTYFSTGNLDMVAMSEAVKSYFENKSLTEKQRIKSASESFSYVGKSLEVTKMDSMPIIRTIIDVFPIFKLFEYGPNPIVQAANILYDLEFLGYTIPTEEGFNSLLELIVSALVDTKSNTPEKESSKEDIEYLIKELIECLKRDDAEDILEMSDITTLLLKF